MMKTIKQIADEIGVSKQAIRNKIEKLGLQGKLAKNANQYEINAKQEKLIRQAFLHKFQEKSSFESARQPQSLHQFQEKSSFESAKQPQNLHQFALQFLEREIEFLKVQLKAKDEQLERLDKRFAEAQILHADTKKMPLHSPSETTAASLGERLKFLFSGKLQKPPKPRHRS
jgi:predicted ArsR family transcriptional regulator